jgi:glycosyltransferase involved in cell wall biosynthesis
LGYPAFLKTVSFFRNRPVKRGDVSPKVSFIIAAYNEENRIREKIENTLAQDYPGEKLETIVVSDCSTDRTDEMVRSYESKGVRLIRAPEREGKEAAQKIAVGKSSGEILVFSDVATLLETNGISNIVRNFNDPTVGCVSSVDRFVDCDGKISGEGAYVRYEMFLRSLETKVNTLVGLSGSFFAARREVCQDWAMDLQSDFNTLLNSVKTGLRGVSDPESIGYYKNIVDEKKEFERKVRTVLRGISVFMRGLPLLNPFKYGLFSWQLFSHKLCRWMVPFALIGAFVSNLLLTSYSVFYLWTFILQFVFYALAFGGVWMTLFSRIFVLKIPSFFVLVNLSILMAWCRYILGERLLAWEPSQR